jgi:hypothetical protein
MWFAPRTRRKPNWAAHLARRLTLWANGPGAPSTRVIAMLAAALLWAGLQASKGFSLPSASQAPEQALAAFNAMRGTFEQLALAGTVAAAFLQQITVFAGRVLLSLSRGHVIVAGVGAPRGALINDLAQDRAEGPAHPAVVVAHDLNPADVAALRRAGVIVVEGDPATPEALKAGRAQTARAVVAIDDDDAANLRIAGALRVLLAQQKRPRGVRLFARIEDARLLAELRDVDPRTNIRREGWLTSGETGFELRPFALSEIAARRFFRAGEVLVQASRLAQDRPHIAILGFAGAGEPIALSALQTLWSAHFEAPRVSVLVADPELEEARFRARWPGAFRDGEVWRADLAFLRFDWSADANLEATLERLAAKRGAPTMLAICLGDARMNAAAALALRKAAARTSWARTPIHVFEPALADLSPRAGALVASPAEPELPAIAVVGGLAEIATTDLILRESLEEGAAIAHAAYARLQLEKDAKARACRPLWESLSPREKALVRDLNPDGGGPDQDRAALFDRLVEALIPAGRKGAARRADRLLSHAMAEEARANPGAAGVDWMDLPETYRAANRAVAEHALVKLWDAGWIPAPPGPRGDVAPDYPNDHIVERLAEIEKKRWNAERLIAGWRYAPIRSNVRREHNLLVTWAQLDGLGPEKAEAQRENDRNMVRTALKIAPHVARYGFLRRTEGPVL